MKEKIHPKYDEVQVTCSCGNMFATRSTSSNKPLHIEVCSQCHPFYTGKQKVMDTAGRIDKFRQRYGPRARGPEDGLTQVPGSATEGSFGCLFRSGV